MTEAEEQELRMLIVAEYVLTKLSRYQSQCIGRHGFQSPAIAHQSMRHSNMTAFKCRYCGFWHVSHIDRGRRLTMLKKA